MITPQSDAGSMRSSIALKRQLKQSIDSEIASRVQQHQGTIAQLRVGQNVVAAAGAPPKLEPLVILAQGDSWFDYPLSGNSLSVSSTDIIAQLTTMGTINPVIVNIAHYGEASTDEMGLPKQQRMIQLLNDPSNWLSKGKPDAILFSAGGNDIAGDQFCIFVGYAASSEDGLDMQRFTEALGKIRASYDDLIAFRDLHAPGVPIFAHCYDFPYPTGTPAACLGPWLLPSLRYAGWNFTDGVAICKKALEAFKGMLQEIAADAANLFFLIDTQGALQETDWANELHPYPAGFRKVAARFVTKLEQMFPGRI